ncbi:MAG TPA: serine/threonine-protein kinase [Candidatus Sulfotelmatobacter sp.]|jgi:serine/threonine protein kinase|nr:serine/threonine-protein kinase [Candidatus Sulfotelmatobacter sp.]
MTPLSDSVVARLRADMQTPDLHGTRYAIVRYLARGGMGSVWLAEDTVLQRRVALKVLDLVAPADDLPARLLQEARILATLEHPGIVPVHDAGTLADGRAFYCMKYVEGQTLAEHTTGLRLSDRLRLLERIAEPLDFAHARGFVHRDLKPENIMIGAFGEVLVMDWGLAKLALTKAGLEGLQSAPNKITSAPTPTPNPSHATAQGSLLGTPGYISPEQASGAASLDYRTDIFSLGAILQFMLNEPAPGDSSAASARIPSPLRAICQKAMAVDPVARYQSAGALAADVASYLNGSPVSAYHENLLEHAARLYARHRTAVVLVAAYLLMRVLFILFARR